MHDSIGPESTTRNLRGVRRDGRAEVDAGVLRAARRRDHHAFALIVSVHQERLNALVYHIVQDRVATQDVVQDALLRAYRALPQFRGRSMGLTQAQAPPYLSPFPAWTRNGLGLTACRILCRPPGSWRSIDETDGERTVSVWSSHSGA